MIMHMKLLMHSVKCARNRDVLAWFVNYVLKLTLLRYYLYVFIAHDVEINAQVTVYIQFNVYLFILYFVY